MKVRITPSKPQGSISIPSSKSISHRAIICASLAQGKSTVSNITFSKDIEATIACMRAFGAQIQVFDSHCEIIGTNLFKQDTPILCDCHESGSTLRFLIPCALLTQTEVTYTGQGRLLSRPMNVYEELFSHYDISFDQTSEHIKVHGEIVPGHFKIQGDVSSQFISGLLFVLPLLNQDSTLEITGNYESKSYVDLTIDMLETFGVSIQQTSDTSYYIQGNQSYIPQQVNVEGDYSQMAFFGVLAALNQTISCENMNLASHQGDKAIVTQLQSAGCKITQEHHSITIEPCKPVSQTIDVSNCPDLAPILCVLASYSQGTTHIINASRLRMKESDRIEAMECELKKWNVDITSDKDSIHITGKPSYELNEPPILHGHNDHRIVMAMTVFGLCANTPSIIEDAQAITKSYPGFFDDIQSLGGKVEIL